MKINKNISSILNKDDDRSIYSNKCRLLILLKTKCLLMQTNDDKEKIQSSKKIL